MAITKVYEAKWRDGFAEMYKGISANAVAAEIMELGEMATPQQIVDMARDEHKESHRCFTWDDAKAAESWRREQARSLTYHLVVNIPRASPEQPEIRFFSKPQNERGYTQTQIIVRNEDRYKNLLAQAMAELHSFKVKYSFLKELGEIMALID